MKEEKLNKGTVNSDPFLCGGKVMLSQWTCCYCNTNKTNDGEIWMLKPICEECLEVKKEEKRMSVMRFYFKGERFVSETDFLKVVKEKENLEKSYDILHETHVEYVEKKVDDRIKFENLLKEKDEEIYNKNKDIDVLLNKINEKDKEIERLKNLYEPEKQYEEWCELSYTYSVDDTTKNVIQNMLLEDAFELIGMDSDNWVGFNVEKYKKEVK